MLRRDFLNATGVVLLGGSTLLHSRELQRESSKLIVHSTTPHNAEPELHQLVQSWITPNEQFYVRSHAPVPKIDTEKFQLSVEGLVDKPYQISLKELQNNFKKQSVIATMTCAGNRRSEHSLTKPVGGVQWKEGAIGNAQWGGALLSELLKKAGIQAEAKHVWFEGVDQIERPGGVIPFGASIPLSKAMSNSESMPGGLACYEMNNQLLTPDHGFPLRTVVPGFIGARSVKWLGKIIVSDKPSTNHYVATAYKLVTEGTAEEWAATAPLMNYIANSVICEPAQGSTFKPGIMTARGYALAKGNRTVQKVELSLDGGKSWTAAKLDSKSQAYCWQLWSANLNVTPRTKQIMVRSTDSQGSVQPQTVPWNLKGYFYNAWHKIPVQVKS